LALPAPSVQATLTRPTNAVLDLETARDDGLIASSVVTVEGLRNTPRLVRAIHFDREVDRDCTPLPATSSAEWTLALSLDSAIGAVG
jgi:hypothetical protein